MLKTYLGALFLAIAPAIVVIGAGYWFLAYGMSQDRYFGVSILGIIIGTAILRAKRIWWVGDVSACRHERQREAPSFKKGNERWKLP
jgi:hypothetical protein